MQQFIQNTMPWALLVSSIMNIILAIALRSARKQMEVDAVANL